VVQEIDYLKRLGVDFMAEENKGNIKVRDILVAEVLR
jgi:hypothetical protein